MCVLNTGDQLSSLLWAVLLGYQWANLWPAACVPVEHFRFQANTTRTSRQVGLQSSVGEVEHELNWIIYFLVL